MQGLAIVAGEASLHPTARRRGVLAAALGLSLALNALPFVSAREGASHAQPAAPVLTARIIDSGAATPALAESAPMAPAEPEAPVLPASRPASRESPATAAEPVPITAPAASAATAAANRPPEIAAPNSALGDSSRPPRPLGEIVPAYPEAADGKHGRVVLQLSIDEQGRVVRADVLNAVPPGYFEDSARAAFLAARFEPALRNGTPVRSQITIEVDYEPADRDGAVSSPRY